MKIRGEPVERTSSTERHRGRRGTAGHTGSHLHKYAFQHVVTARSSVLGTNAVGTLRNTSARPRNRGSILGRINRTASFPTRSGGHQIS